ncbi:GNAT family N-acetyltransferase [Catenovulum sediminis]|uniref:GNAT family N-acetyltransferase n=1 Tax=Catenovulum sediminis TaxID=1740262 RepID=A0ABV1RFJ7_9ALTE|nr:GNAT family N-acetyltransferase [Catenovulum sediminis]
MGAIKFSDLPSLSNHHVDLVRMTDENIADTISQWLVLERESQGSFFTSVCWLKHFVSTSQTPPYLARIFGAGQLTGLAFVFFRQKKFIKQAWINRSGDPREDQVWLEYNQVLTTEDPRTQLAILSDYLCRVHSVDEINIGTSTKAQLMNHQSNVWSKVLWQAKGYSCTLDASKSNLSGLLSHFSKNTRSQIKRSIKLLNGMGNVSLRRASQVDEALMAFEEAGKLHKLKWQDKSGFVNPFFQTFHVQLIKGAFPHNIDFWILRVGETDCAYVYNFIYRKTAYFYLAGFQTFSDNKIKIGLVSHVLIMLEYARLGFTCYDFMAGDDRYKKSLSDKVDEQFIVSYRVKNGFNLVRYFYSKIKTQAVNFCRGVHFSKQNRIK